MQDRFYRTLLAQGDGKKSVGLQETKPGRAVMPSLPWRAQQGGDMNARPNIIVVDDEPTALASLLDALTRRYGGDYRVIPHL